MNEVEFLESIHGDMVGIIGITSGHAISLNRITGKIRGRLSALEIEANKEITNEQLKNYIQKIVKKEIKNQIKEEK